MQYVLICKDSPTGDRMAHREAHLAYVKESGRVEIGGPFLSDDGEKMIGSLIVMEADSRADVEAWSAKDPYVTGGVFESVEIIAWKRTV